MKNEVIKEFLNKKNTIGLVGVTINRDKWGYKKYQELKNAGFEVYPINPKYKNINDDKCFSSIKKLIEFLHKKPDMVITITPSDITEKIVEQCKNYGIKKIWMQPGSESKKSINICKENEIKVMYGVCIVADALNKI